MALPLVTAAVTLFYLSAIPLEIAVCLRAGEHTGFAAGLALFVPDAALRHAIRKIEDSESAGLRSSAIRRWLTKQLLPSLRSHLRLESVRLEGSLGTGDAASTALACGTVAALAQSLQGRTGHKIVCRLKPDFSGAELHVSLSGMISVRVGHIMLAALFGLIDYASGRLKPWKSTPLKAS